MIRTARTALAAAGVLALSLATAPGAHGAAPSEDACHTVSSAMPVGDCGPFRQVLAENFNGDHVPAGAFSDCDHNTEGKLAYCSGLPADYRREFWAYPTGWQDTQKSNGQPGGVYHPEDTVSVLPDEHDGDGEMRIRMYRPASGGDVHSAAVLPLAVKDQTYGKYSERFSVTTVNKGFKSAHLLWPVNDSTCNSCEMDFPEGEWNGTISAYHHPEGGGEQDAFETSAKWTSWHTTSVEWTPGEARYYLDGKLVGKSSRGMMRAPADWILQNETAMNGQYPAPGTSAEMRITWVAAYTYRGIM